MNSRITRWRPHPIPENKIFVAAIATVGVGAAQGILNSFDVFGSKAMTEFLAFVVCVWLFPYESRRKWTFWLGVCLLALGILGGAVWVLAVGFPARHETNFIPFSDIPTEFYVLGLVTGCIVAPLFEEKVVRHLLLDGVSHYFGRVVGILLVSAVFAAVHVGAVVSSFLYSIFLCICVHPFRLNTAQRAIIHGGINLAITQWVIFYPTMKGYSWVFP